MSRPRPVSLVMSPDDVFYELSDITDYLLLGGAPAVTVESIVARRITCVINVTELPNLPVNGIDYLRIVIDDVPTAQLCMYFDSAADAVERQRRRGGRTLVHCVAGVSRSASLVLAHQVKYGELSLREAFARLRARRPVVRPNAGFFRQLIEFERRERGCTSVRMVPHPAGGGQLIPDVYEPDYRRLVAGADWLRSNSLGQRVSIFRNRQPAQHVTGAATLDSNGNQTTTNDHRTEDKTDYSGDGGGGDSSCRSNSRSLRQSGLTENMLAVIDSLAVSLKQLAPWHARSPDHTLW